MINRWRKVDLAVGLLVGLTFLSYFLFQRTIFKIFLWLALLAVLIRVLLVVKRSLWKIRNRLIFSALFLVVTPLFLIMLFIWTIGNVIITQYGSVIMDNIMSNQLNNAEELANSFLRYDNSRLMVVAFNVTMKIRYPYFNAVFWERNSK